MLWRKLRIPRNRECAIGLCFRFARSKARGHLEELLDEGLKATFPASDPISVGHFTSTEPPSQPIDRAVADLTRTAEIKSRRTQVRARRYG